MSPPFLLEGHEIGFHSVRLAPAHAARDWRCTSGVSDHTLVAVILRHHCSRQGGRQEEKKEREDAHVTFHFHNDEARPRPAKTGHDPVFTIAHPPHRPFCSLSLVEEVGSISQRARSVLHRHLVKVPAHGRRCRQKKLVGEMLSLATVRTRVKSLFVCLLQHRSAPVTTSGLQLTAGQSRHGSASFLGQKLAWTEARVLELNSWSPAASCVLLHARLPTPCRSGSLPDEYWQDSPTFLAN